MNVFRLAKRIPQGLKPAFLLVLKGTAEAVPFPKPCPTQNYSSQNRALPKSCPAQQSFPFAKSCPTLIIS